MKAESIATGRQEEKQELPPERLSNHLHSALKDCRLQRTVAAPENKELIHTPRSQEQEK
jgi:hypothetical protein